MSEENKTVELEDQELESVTGGERLGSFVKHETTYWVCPHCNAEIIASYTYISKHLFENHNQFYNFANWDEAYEYVKTIDWWY